MYSAGSTGTHCSHSNACVRSAREIAALVNEAKIRERLAARYGAIREQGLLAAKHLLCSAWTLSRMWSDRPWE